MLIETCQVDDRPYGADNVLCGDLELAIAVHIEGYFLAAEGSLRSVQVARLELGIILSWSVVDVVMFQL